MDAYVFNGFMLEVGRELNLANKDSFALALCDKSINNLLYVLEYMPMLIKARENGKVNYFEIKFF